MLPSDAARLRGPHSYRFSRFAAPEKLEEVWPRLGESKRCLDSGRAVVMDSAQSRSTGFHREKSDGRSTVEGPPASLRSLSGRLDPHLTPGDRQGLSVCRLELRGRGGSRSGRLGVGDPKRDSDEPHRHALAEWCRPQLHSTIPAPVILAPPARRSAAGVDGRAAMPASPPGARIQRSAGPAGRGPAQAGAASAPSRAPRLLDCGGEPSPRHPQRELRLPPGPTRRLRSPHDGVEDRPVGEGRRVSLFGRASPARTLTNPRPGYP
jgi:hypothetical protein